MLFSELNRINLNVLIQDPKFEAVPDLNKCYVHNKLDWTLWCEKIYEDSTVAHFVEDESSTYCGWELKEISSTPIQDSYLGNALTDISNDLIVNSKDDDVESDIVKIYAGELEIDGTLNYNAFIENEDILPECRQPISHDKHFPHFLGRNTWWTFNNGAFQWIGGPKSIFECRFSYGPFSHPFPQHDPHHCDTNHEMLDDYLHLSKLPNLNFIFDTKHVLKGIVSLPCANEQLKIMTKNFIGNFLNFAWENFHEMSFKNFDTILREFSQIYAYIPTIRVIHKAQHKPIEKPIHAVFELMRKPYIIKPENNKYIFPDVNDFNSFINKSIWKTYSIDTLCGIAPFPEVTEITSYVPELTEESTLGDTMKRINEFAGSIYKVYNNFDRVTLYTILSESYLISSKETELDSTALMTLSDIFKNAKNIRNTIDGLYNNEDIDKIHIIVLPEKFCNKEILKLISNVRYVYND